MKTLLSPGKRWLIALILTFSAGCAVKNSFVDGTAPAYYSCQSILQPIGAPPSLSHTPSVSGVEGYGGGC
jgi:hypothetical protein